MCISILIGTAALLAAYALPTTEMRENVRRSCAIYEYEGVYPQIVSGYKLSQLDNCTDAIMLLTAIDEGTGDIIKDAMINARPDYAGVDPVTSLIAYANGSENEMARVPYSRYWHGYVVVLKVLLLLFDVSDIRIINMFLQMGMLIYIIFLMAQKDSKSIFPVSEWNLIIKSGSNIIVISIFFHILYYVNIGYMDSA